MPPNRTLTSPNPPSPLPGTILLETPRLILRRYTPADAPALSAAANHTNVAATLSDRFASPYTVEAAAEFIAGDGKGADPHYPTHGAILLKPLEGETEGVMIGGFGLRPLQDVFYRTWALGYFLTPSAWGKGYGTEAISAVVRWAFETWPGLNRIDGEAYSSNMASVRVLEKSGFVREGVRRRAVEKGGVVLDVVALGVVRADLGL
ncbi:acetyltransferase [Pochonia chlamydosporia 170]|uniref:Acetyltransferase n=1 Tax=Pochonia chlamydosporia 170 TaxID=1380566 RepID=A0A179G425_METCM|nr:acetyltransferase [Pochonia chlamydosporia 170]OAQ72260.1 acetyltransferase [Pochonia chlamydosporia 170]